MYNVIEDHSNHSTHSKATGSLRFYSKDEATNFNADMENTNNFKSFKYRAKSLGNIVADEAHGMLKNATIAVPLKYLRNIWRSLEMPLINYDIELKLKSTKYCILSAAGNENVINDNDNPNNIILTIKDTKLYVPVVTLSAIDNEKLSKPLSKGLSLLI